MKHIWVKNWNTITQIASWIVGIVSSFVISPTLDSPDDQRRIWSLNQFLITFLVVAFVIIARCLNNRKYLTLWSILAFIFLFSGLYTLNCYDTKYRTCTCKYYSKTILIGTILKSPEKDSLANCRDLIKGAAGETAEIWTDDSIELCRKYLMYYYIGIVPLFTTALISILQALYLSKKRKNPKPKPARKQVKKTVKKQSR